MRTSTRDDLFQFLQASVKEPPDIRINLEESGVLTVLPTLRQYLGSLVLSATVTGAVLRSQS